MEYDKAPDWLKAVDVHNISGQGDSLLTDSGTSDSTDNSPGILDSVSKHISNIPDAAISATISAAASFVNTGVDIANIFLPKEAELTPMDPQATAASLDSDLGEYYKNNTGFADTLGFIGGSLIPSTLAVKGLKFGQEALAAATVGKVGTGMSRATGLLVPAAELQVETHAATLAARNATWKLTQADTLKSVALGVQEGVLQGIAMETAVAATMYKSPVFDNMDAGDMLVNSAENLLLFGGLGAVVGVAKSRSGVSALLKNADARQTSLASATIDLRAAGKLEELAGEPGHVATNEADSILAAVNDKVRIADAVTAEDVLALKVAQGEKGFSISKEATEAEAAFLNSQREQNIRKLDNSIRINIRGLEKSPIAATDTTFGNTVADIFSKAPPQGAANLFDQMLQYVRVGERSVYDKAVLELARSNKISRVEAAAALGDDPTTYVQLHSGAIGTTVIGKPEAPRLADLLSPSKLEQKVEEVKVKNGTSVERFIPENPLTPLDLQSAEARWIAARKLTDREAANIGTLKKPVHEDDLPLLMRAVKFGNIDTAVITADKELQRFTTKKELEDFYREAQLKAVKKLQDAGVTPAQIEIITDVRADYIKGTSKLSRDHPDNFSAQETNAKELNTFLSSNKSALDMHYLPKYMKVSYASTAESTDGMLLKGMQGIAYRQALYTEVANRAVAKVLGPGVENFIPYSKELLSRLWRGGTGQGLIHGAESGLGSFESVTSQNANIVSKLEKQIIERAKTSLDGASQLLVTDPATAIRFSAITEIIAGQPEKFVMNEAGDALIPRKVRDWEDAIARGEDVPPPDLALGTPESIPLADEKIRKVVSDHIAATATREERNAIISAAQGTVSQRYGDTFYPVRQDPRQFKHVAFVIDPTLTGVGHKRMLLARNGAELEEKISRVPAHYKVIRSGETEEYHKAVGDWLYDKTLHENYLDTELTSAGIRSNFFPMTDPQLIADTFIQHHVRAETAMFREAVKLKFQPVISALEKRGSLYAGTHESATDHISKLAISSRNNPYMAQVKSLLNISRLEDVPGYWISAQQALDRGITAVWNRVTDIARNARLTSDESLSTVRQVNKEFDNLTRYESKSPSPKAEMDNFIAKSTEEFNKAGFRSAYWGAAEQIFANTRVPQGVLSTFIRTANAFLVNTVLRWDPVNALINKIGNGTIMSGELQSLISAIKSGDAKVAGELAQFHIGVPGVDTATIFSPLKLIAKAYSDLSGPESKVIWQELKNNGIIPDLMEQYHKGIDAVTILGSETVEDLTGKTAQIRHAIAKWGEVAAKGSGNEWAERWNRAASAMVMKNITDLAVKAGKLSEAESWAYINTFTNRINGVIRAAERPLMFQGPIGQAMGLFQNYQLNLMQQAFRHIGEGRGKTLALMAGMQTTLFGASSLPGFNLINTYLIGQAQGNKNHSDINTGAQNLLGKTGAEWLMYGAPSNMLNAAIFSRGDTNPRTWTVVPNPAHPSELPIVSAYAGAAGSMYRATKAVANGAPVWESFLSGLEHLGLSRPLAGLAVSARALTSPGLKAHSTQLSGNFLYENDLLSLSTLMRIAGAKPMDEAVMQNNYYRINSYAAYDRKRRNDLGESIRATLSNGKIPSNEQIGEFAKEYAARGGSQTGFNSYFMNQYKNSTTSQAKQLSEKLSSPYGRSMQYLLGGQDELGALE